MSLRSSPLPISESLSSIETVIPSAIKQFSHRLKISGKEVYIYTLSYMQLSMFYSPMNFSENIHARWIKGKKVGISIVDPGIKGSRGNQEYFQPTIDRAPWTNEASIPLGRFFSRKTFRVSDEYDCLVYQARRINTIAALKKAIENWLEK